MTGEIVGGVDAATQTVGRTWVGGILFDLGDVLLGSRAGRSGPHQRCGRREGGPR